MSDEERLARRAGRPSRSEDAELDRVLLALRTAILSDDARGERKAARQVTEIRRAQVEEHLAAIARLRRRNEPTPEEVAELDRLSAIEAARIQKVFDAQEEPRRAKFDQAMRRADAVLREFGQPPPMQDGAQP